MVSFKSLNCIKRDFYIYENAETDGKPIQNKVYGTIIKWYQVKMSYEEKYRFGVITYPEFLEWQQELMKEGSEQDTPNTFWAHDDALRQNVSSADYSSFLNQNNIDISNNTTLNMEEILRTASEADVKMSDPLNEKELCIVSGTDGLDRDAMAILNQVNKDLHQGEAILTQEEIEALFAAAGV